MIAQPNQRSPATVSSRPESGARWSDWLIAAGFALVTIGAHWPMRTQMLAYWDSILYARALIEFNPVVHQPQPPGYFFYVQSVRLAHWLGGGDANTALVWVSLIAAGGMVGAISLGGTALYGRATGLGAGLLGLTSVAPWSYSGVAYPYTVLAFGSALLGWLAWLTARGRIPPWLAGLVLGLLGGFRQDLIIFLGPLFLVSLGWRSVWRLAAAAVGGLLGVASWFVPTMLASGGLSRYLGSLGRQTILVERDTSIIADGLGGLIWNIQHLQVFLIEQTLIYATVPIAIYLLDHWRGGRLWRDERARHLLLWSGPALLFYTLIHLGDVGYVFSLLPPLMIAAGAGGVIVSRWVVSVSLWRGWRLALPFGLIVTPALVAWSLVIGGPALFNDYHVFHTGRQYSHLWGKCRDGWLRNSIELLRKDYPSNETVLVAAGYYQHARHYLPEHTAWLAEPNDGPRFRQAVPAGVRSVVAYGHRMATRGQPNEQRIVVSCDITLSIFAVQPGQIVVYVPDELWIE